MKFQTLTLISATTLLAAMAIPVQLSAQEQQEHTSGAPSPILTRFNLTRFNAPHAPKGLDLGTSTPVNKADGAIAGAYQEASKVDDARVGTADGSAAPNIITFDAPHAGKAPGPGSYAQGTYPIVNNAGGAITGFYIDAKNVYHGFLRTPSGTITSFDVPGAAKGIAQGTVPQGINDAGTITGDTR